MKIVNYNVRCYIYHKECSKLLPYNNYCKEFNSDFDTLEQAQIYAEKLLTLMKLLLDLKQYKVEHVIIIYGQDKYYRHIQKAYYSTGELKYD